MSATRELLVEQIAQTEDAIKAAEITGQPVAMLHDQLVKLREQLVATNQTLTEGTLLKD